MVDEAIRILALVGVGIALGALASGVPRGSLYAILAVLVGVWGLKIAELLGAG